MLMGLELTRPVITQSTAAPRSQEGGGLRRSEESLTRPRRGWRYLLLHGVSLGHHGVEVVTFGDALGHLLLDLQLQVGVGALQRAHLHDRRAKVKERFLLLPRSADQVT